MRKQNTKLKVKRNIATPSFRHHIANEKQHQLIANPLLVPLLCRAGALGVPEQEAHLTDAELDRLCRRAAIKTAAQGDGLPSFKPTTIASAIRSAVSKFTGLFRSKKP